MAAVTRVLLVPGAARALAFLVRLVVAADVVLARLVEVALLLLVGRRTSSSFLRPQLGLAGEVQSAGQEVRTADRASAVSAIDARATAGAGWYTGAGAICE
jgi:hypothetical protein